MKLLLDSKIGKACITTATLTTWNVINLFKVFLIGGFDNPADSRFKHIIHPRFGIHLSMDKIPVKVKQRKIDITRPFYGINKKDIAINHELYVWANGKGFHKLIKSDIAPAEIVERMNFTPEYIVVLSSGHNNGKHWVSISSSEWAIAGKGMAKRQQTDWHVALVQQAQKYA